MEIKTLTVGMLGTCCYVVYDEAAAGCVVIDPGADADRILRAAGNRPIEAILLTHGHFDHIEAVAELMQSTTQLIIHRDDSEMPQDPRLNASWLIGRRVTAPAPTMTVREGSEVTFAGVRFTVLHTPGHTPGSVCYQAGDALFTGDTLFEHGWGRTDLPGGSDTQLAASLRRLYPLARQLTIYPGHGG